MLAVSSCRYSGSRTTAKNVGGGGAGVDRVCGLVWCAVTVTVTGSQRASVGPTAVSSLFLLLFNFIYT